MEKVVVFHQLQTQWRDIVTRIMQFGYSLGVGQEGKGLGWCWKEEKDQSIRRGENYMGFVRMVILNCPFRLKTLIFKLMLLDLFIFTLYENFCEQLLFLWAFAFVYFFCRASKGTHTHVHQSFPVSLESHIWQRALAFLGCDKPSKSLSASLCSVLRLGL